MLYGVPLWECNGCGLISSVPSSSGEAALENHPRTHEAEFAASESITLTEAARRYQAMLGVRDSTIKNIVLIAPPYPALRKAVEDGGMRVLLHLSMSEFMDAVPQGQAADAILFVYQLEKSPAPHEVLDRAHFWLKSGGTLLVVTPSLDSRPARVFGTSWTEWRPEIRYFFDNATIQSLLLGHGFNEVRLEEDLRWYTLAHIHDRAQTFPPTWITHIVHLAYQLLPSAFHEIDFRLPSSGIVVTAKKSQRRDRPLLSIVVPVYNEHSTFPLLIEQLVGKSINGVDKEIIIVESNSTDGSREQVLAVKDDPGVRIFLQDHPRGKGNAVREGLEHATGDVVLIQDADLEYDLNDYDAVLEPLLRFRSAFVLGSRHSGTWKMRHFADQRHLSTYFNLGHMLFTTLLNILYGQRMKDPFTMYKVFRRDCLYRLKFECSRFDFDYELVIKLIRKGYTPLEIPVNYNSRSFKEGKKVDMFRDPLTWLKASFKYRFVSIYTDHDG